MNDTLQVILDTDTPPKTEAERRLWMATRQALIIQIGAIEDFLGIDRSIVPRRKREQERDERKAS